MMGTASLRHLGQSIWLDTLNRQLLTSGTLRRYIDDYGVTGVTGVTSDPAILGRAVPATSDDDDQLRAAFRQGDADAQHLVYASALEDVCAASDLFRETWEASQGRGGWLSIGVPPEYAYDRAPTIEWARQLAKQANRPNVFIKVPGTAAGVTATEELIAAGIPVNVTLLFSSGQYSAAAASYLRGLERRRRLGQSLSVASVASVFVSRWDQAANNSLPRRRRDRLGVAMAHQIYADQVRILQSPRWASLAAEGAHPQRLLWASTSVTNPDLAPSFYTRRLALPDTINTMPEQTLLALTTEGTIPAVSAAELARARTTLESLAQRGIDPAGLGEALQHQGVRSFVDDWQRLLDTVEGMLFPSRWQAAG
jgi:transaldolase